MLFQFVLVHCTQILDFAHCLAYAVEQISVLVTLPDELHSKNTMDDAIMIHCHDRTAFLTLLDPILFFQEKVKVF